MILNVFDFVQVRLFVCTQLIKYLKMIKFNYGIATLVVLLSAYLQPVVAKNSLMTNFELMITFEK